MPNLIIIGLNSLPMVCLSRFSPDITFSTRTLIRCWPSLILARLGWFQVSRFWLNLIGLGRLPGIILIGRFPGLLVELDIFPAFILVLVLVGRFPVFILVGLVRFPGLSLCCLPSSILVLVGRSPVLAWVLGGRLPVLVCGRIISLIVGWVPLGSVGVAVSLLLQFKFILLVLTKFKVTWRKEIQ